MNKQQQEDLERTNKLKRIVWGHYARNSLCNRETDITSYTTRMK